MFARANVALLSILAALALGGAFPAAAQTPERRFELFSEFGGSFFSQNSTNTRIPVLDTSSGQFVFADIRRTSDLATTGRFFAGFRYYFSRMDAFEASYSYSPTDVNEKDMLLEDSNLVIVTVGLSVKSAAHYVSFNYVRYLAVGGRVRPFITGGLGVAHFPHSFQPTKLAGNFGGGLDLSVHERVLLRFEYRDFLVRQPRVFAPPSSPEGLTHNHGPFAGIVLRF